MRQFKIRQAIIDALASHNFSGAEKLAIQALNKNNLNAQMWMYLTEALAFQGFGKTARKTLERAWLLDPQAVWVEKANCDIIKNDKGLERQDVDVLLQVKDITVCAALIVKNEEKHIKNCISHLYNAVDEIVVVDTGSDDKTIEILMTFDKVKVIEFKWCDDFSAARNAAFPHIKSDWVFWVDADEYLFENDIEYVRQAAALFDSFNVPVLLRVGIVNEYENHHSITSYDAIRLFSMKYGLKYSYKIHEQIIITDESMLINGVMVSNPVKIRLRHLGYMKSESMSKDKYRRNIKLLKEMMNEDSKNPLWYFFAGRELFCSGNYEEAIKCLNNCITLAKSNPSFGRILDAYTYLVKAYMEIQNIEKAEVLCLEAIKVREDFPDVQYLYGLINFIKANNYYKLAEEYVIKSKQTFNSYRDIVTPDIAIYNWKANLLHADIALFVSKFADAKVLYEKAFQSSPSIIKEKIIDKLDYIQEEKKKLLKLSYGKLINKT